MANTYNRMILNRIHPVLYPLLRPNQNGFRQKRSTVNHILAIRRILEGIANKNVSAVLTFIDFNNAFDSIHRGMMTEVLRSYGIPNKLVNAINGAMLILERKYTHQMAYMKRFIKYQEHYKGYSLTLPIYYCTRLCT